MQCSKIHPTVNNAKLRSVSLVVVMLTAIAAFPQETTTDCGLPAYRFKEPIPPGEAPPQDKAFGTAMAGLGDINEDGVPDYCVGAPHHDATGEDCGNPSFANMGRIYFYSGRTHQPLKIAGRDALLVAPAACTGFGAALANIGPLMPGENMTGKAYLAVGAPCSLQMRGILHVYRISKTGITELAGLRLTGQEPGDRLGACVASAGDVNGDGSFEIMVGVPGSDAGGLRAGEAILLDGDGAILSATHGQNPFEGYGFSVSSAGDFDGDGLGDILIGSQDDRPEGSAGGRITVVTGAGDILFSRPGTGSERLGCAVASAGDIDGDGFDDIIAGADHTLRYPFCVPQIQPGATDPGKAYLIRGGDKTPADGGTRGLVRFTWRGGHEGAGFGCKVLSPGDIDNDGINDVCVTSPDASANGAARAGNLYFFSGADGELIWVLSERTEGATLGRSAAMTGDLDGDGVADILAGSRQLSGDVALFSLGDADGNGIRDACQDCPSLTTLSVDEPVVSTFNHFTRRRCFRLDPMPGSTLRITLASLSPDDIGIVSAQWQTPDFSTRPALTMATPDAGTRGLVIPRTLPDPLFIRVEALKITDALSRFSLLIEAVDGTAIQKLIPHDTAVDADPHFNAAIYGTHLADDQLVFSLIHADGEVTLTAQDVHVVSGERVDILFNLSGAPVGVYALRAHRNDELVSLLNDALEIHPPAGGSALRVILDSPGQYRNNAKSRMTVTIINTGDRPLPAPLFKLTGPAGTVFNLPNQPYRHLNQFFGLGYFPLSSDGSIPPREKVVIPVWFHTLFTEAMCPQHNVKGDACTGRYSVHLFESARPNPILWDLLEAPPGMDPAAWPDVKEDLKARLGETWPDFHGAMLDHARRLAQRGRPSFSLLAPFALAVREALGMPASAITGTVLDDENGAAMPGIAVVAVQDDQVHSFSPVTRDGFFSIDWLENGASYFLEVVNLQTGRLHNADAPEVDMPQRGDLLNLQITASRESSDTVLMPDCMPCSMTGLPEAPLAPPDPLFTPRDHIALNVISALDPNEKDGSGSQGGSTEIAPGETIDYRIYFENISDENGAAARTVRIVDVLDPKLDWTTVTLKDVYIAAQPEEILLSFEGEAGDMCDTAPIISGYPVGGISNPANPGSQDGHLQAGACWSGTVQFKYDDQRTVDLTLYVTASVSPGTDYTIHDEEYGVITWTIAADLGNLSQVDIDSGFLAYGCPEEEGDGEGEGINMCSGYVTFSVKSRTDVEDEIFNSAEITFDELDSVTTDPASTITVGHMPPSEPSEPNPEADGESTEAAVRLSWHAAYASEYEVYLWNADQGSERPDDAQQAMVWEMAAAEPCYPSGEDPLTLPLNQTYRWQVICKNNMGESTEGPVWQFTTTDGDGEALFIRGDVDGNGKIQLNDPILILMYLFSDTYDPACMDAMDANDSGNIDLADPVKLLGYLYNSEALPAPAHPDCGTDPDGDADGLDCAAHPICQSTEK